MNKYKLKCFSCGQLFPSKEDVYRVNGYPYCGECIAGYYDDYYHEEDPRSDQEKIDEANIARYGEY